MSLGKNLEEFCEFISKRMRDDKSINRLIGDVEHNQSQIENAVELALDDFNNTILPYTSYSIDRIESFPSLKMLADSTVIELLISAGILMSRNRLNYSDGGISVQVSDKAGDYKGWVSDLMASYERRKAAWKNNLNVQRGWGSISSPYSDTYFRY